MLLRKCDICGKTEREPVGSAWRHLNYNYIGNGDGKDRDGYGLFIDKDICRICHDKISEALRQAIEICNPRKENDG